MPYPACRSLAARSLNGWTRWLVGALLLVMFAQLVCGARHLSMTSDEPSHIVAGLTYLATGDLWIPPLHGHPPLINVLAAWPLLLQPERPPFRALAGWGDDFSTYVRATWPLLGPIERVAFVTRLPIMLMALALAALVFRWTSQVFGRPAGVLAVALMAFDPNMIAHAQLDTTDLGMALMGFAALYIAWRAAISRTPRAQWTGVVVSSLLLGLAMAAKGSGFLYTPAICAVLVWGHAPEWWVQRRLTGVGRLGSQIATVGTVALLTLWGVYRLQVGPLPGSDVILPFPSHFGLWQTVFRDMERVAFLRGETKIGGWWWYFPYSTAIKTPIPLLIAMALAAVAWLRGGRSLWWKMLPLLVFPALYWVTAIRSQMNIGHRHLLPTYPFIYSFVSQLATSMGRLPRIRSGDFSRPPAGRATKVVTTSLPFIRWGLAAILLGWYVLEAARIYPFYLAYFNQFVGGPRYGYRYLVDSNVDWGQSFIALRDFMEREAIEEVRLSYYTYVDPAVYGVQYEPLPPAPGVTEDAISRFAPQPTVYAISATPLQGVMTAQTDLYDWFRHREPDAQVGYGLLIYRVESEDVAVEWVAQCTTPVAPLPPEEIARGEGRQVRSAYFDCEEAWLYPSGGQTAGHYVLARDQNLLNHPFVQARLRSALLVYEQRLPGVWPAFVVYAEPELSAPVEQPVWSAPSAWSPLQVRAEGTSVPLPTTLEGPLTFLGARVDAGPYRPGGVVGMDTYWHVVEPPGGRWLSVMAHLLADDGRLAAGDDGMGVPIDQWQPGDVIVQHHALSLPAEAAARRYWLQTGVYWLDSLARWNVLQQGEAVGDRLLVGEVQVEP